MKRLISIIISLCLLCALSACDSSSTETAKEQRQRKHRHSFSEATCMSPAKCKCGVTEGESLEHIYDASGKCVNCDSVAEGATEFITFQDVFLENYVKQQLGIDGTGKVSQYAMSQLTEIILGEGVQDAQDLMYAVNLQSVSIESDNIQNLSVLCNIPTITFVGFGFWKEIDISFMRNMQNVENIFFNNPYIVGGELSDLVSSPKLNQLFLYVGDSINIDFLGSAAGLETLELWHAFGEEDDISVLKSLPNLKYLEILNYDITTEQRAVFEELLKKGITISFI